mgnify:CR=1 FL=1
MYNPISCEFFDQLTVAIQRKIPSTIVYLDEGEKQSVKGLVRELIVQAGKEFLVLTNGQKIRLDLVITLNGKRHREE